MKMLLIIIRMAAGFIFIFSGFVKAVDPLGSAFKFQDYFTAFNLDFLFDFSLFFSIFLSALEFIVGISLFFDLRHKYGAWGALLFMSLFTPLTFVLAITNPVSDCGCFGDALILTNWQTFYKNLIILSLVLITFYYRKQFLPLYKAGTEWLVLACFIVIITGFSAYGLRHLPLIDFRPYNVGASVIEGLAIPDNAEPDLYSTTLTYEKNGILKDFSEDNFPWQDSSWHFVDQESVLLKEGYRAPMHDFTITSFSGEDISYDVLENPGYSFLVVSRELSGTAKGSLKKINELALPYVLEKNIGFYGITASGVDETEKYWDSLYPVFKFYSCDETCLKTIIRANPGVLLLKEGVIIGKWTWKDMPEAAEFTEYMLAHQITAIRKNRDRWKIITLSSLILLIWIFAKARTSYART